jgi:hypothetical protein
MKVANFVGVKDKESIKTKVFIEDGVDVPEFIKCPITGAPLKLSGTPATTQEKPLKQNIIIRNLSEDELDKQASVMAKAQMKDFEDNPSKWPNVEDLKKFDEKHWISEFKKVLKKQGTLEVVK